MDTDLNLIRDLIGRRTRISFRRSSFWAINSAESDGGEGAVVVALAGPFWVVLAVLADDIFGQWKEVFVVLT